MRNCAVLYLYKTESEEQCWGNYPSDATVIFVELLASTFLALLIIASVAAIGVIYGIPNMANTENRAIQLAD